jgi:phosphoglycerate dehydrogenase-like enzyme
MKKRTTSNLTVKRISTSPYFQSTFLELEKEKIENLRNIQMLDSHSDKIAHILITNTHTDVSCITNEQMNICELMIHPNSGYDNLSSDFVNKATFPIVIGNPIRAFAVSNFILSTLYHHYSPVPHETHWSQSRKWPRKLLNELNILIIGLGHIGTIIKNSLTPLGATLHLYDPYLGLNDLVLKNIDVVIPVCGLNLLNQQMIDKNFLSQLNPDFLLINAARGGLLKTSDLLDILKNQPMASAALDVFEKEPADFSQFIGLDNIAVSSHIAGVYKSIDAVTAEFEAVVIKDFTELPDNDFNNKYAKMILKNRLTKDGILI